MANLLCDIHNDECQGIHLQGSAVAVDPNILQPSGVLWAGDKPCSMCASTLHSQYESKAQAYVCAGCYNEFALEKGWEK
jgi:hypothetical protein